MRTELAAARRPERALELPKQAPPHRRNGHNGRVRRGGRSPPPVGRPVV
jgi:hypothetical protein